MAQVDQIKSEIESLSSEDFAQLREWVTKKDWELWDVQLKKDVASGKLDFLCDEAEAAKAGGQLKDL